MLHNNLTIGRLHITHTLAQGVHILLRDAVVGICHKDVIGVACATHKLTRNGYIGIGNGDTSLLLCLLARTTQRIDNHLAVIDQTCQHTIATLGHDSLNIHSTLCGQ